MIPAPFAYEVAATLEDAVGRLARTGPEAKLLAGGQSLLPLMKLRRARPSVLIDIGRLEGLAFIREAAERISIGALTTHADVARHPVLRAGCPLVSHAAALIGDPQVRHRGTIGGALAHGDPASDLGTVLLAIDAEVLVYGPEGERTIPVSDLFLGPHRTSLGPDEIIAMIDVPAMDLSDGWAYERFAVRPQGTIVSSAVVLRGTRGLIREAAIALGNMGPNVSRASVAEHMLTEHGAEAIPEAAQATIEGTAPIPDVDAPAHYRRHLATVLTRRALVRASDRLPSG